MNWMNFALIAGGLLGSLVVGLIVGRVVAGIKYPNPDKPHIFKTIGYSSGSGTRSNCTGHFCHIVSAKTPNSR